MLRVGGKSGSDIIRAELDRVLAEAERVAIWLGKQELRLAQQGHWLDTHQGHSKWEDRETAWIAGLDFRESLYDQIGAMARKGDYLWSQLPEGGEWGSVDVWHIKNRYAPCIGLFWETGDFEYGDPEQYAPQGWRPREGV